MNLSVLAKLKKPRTSVLLLALLIALATSVSSAHVHSLEKADHPARFEQIEDCALCHSGLAFTFESGTPYEGSRLLHAHFETSSVSSVLLGYSYIPESRGPPAIS